MNGELGDSLFDEGQGDRRPGAAGPDEESAFTVKIETGRAQGVDHAQPISHIAGPSPSGGDAADDVRRTKKTDPVGHLVEMLYDRHLVRNSHHQPFQIKESPHRRHKVVEVNRPDVHRHQNGVCTEFDKFGRKASG